jgi:hypothetical protein
MGGVTALTEHSDTILSAYQLMTYKGARYGQEGNIHKL